MAELLGKNEQLAVRDFQGSRGRGTRRTVYPYDFRLRANHVDPDRNAVLQFDLANRDRTIRAIEHALNETALRVPRAISKLWHGLENKLNSET